MDYATTLGLTLPVDYLEFLSISDGGEGDVGEGYIGLWPVGKVLDVASGEPIYDDFSRLPATARTLSTALT